MKFIFGIVVALLLLCPIPVQSFDVLTDETLCLASNIYYESRGEPLKGQYMVAYVTMNRVKSKLYPDTICNVVKQKNQFSWYRNRRVIYPRHISKDSAWLRAIKIAVEVTTHSAPIPDVSKGSLWYHATHSRPVWRHKLERVAVVGNHIFYRKKDS